jgi:hypothetical protein
MSAQCAIKRLPSTTSFIVSHHEQLSRMMNAI